MVFQLLYIIVYLPVLFFSLVWFLIYSFLNVAVSISIACALNSCYLCCFMFSLSFSQVTFSACLHRCMCKNCIENDRRVTTRYRRACDGNLHNNGYNDSKHRIAQKLPMKRPASCGSAALAGDRRRSNWEKDEIFSPATSALLQRKRASLRSFFRLATHALQRRGREVC